MESGLDGRNNDLFAVGGRCDGQLVSMESGLDGRNNVARTPDHNAPGGCLNGVRPRWPEQFYDRLTKRLDVVQVSMESGLDGRNNSAVNELARRKNQSQWSPA